MQKPGETSGVDVTISCTEQGEGSAGCLEGGLWMWAGKGGYFPMRLLPMEQRLWGLPGRLGAVFWDTVGDCWGPPGRALEWHLGVSRDELIPVCFLLLALGHLELKQLLVPTTSRAAEKGLTLGINWSSTLGIPGLGRAGGQLLEAATSFRHVRPVGSREQGQMQLLDGVE